MAYWEYLIDFGLPLVLAVWGGYWMKRGLWPRRRDAAPRCAKCGYDMRGLGAGVVTCVECGHAAADENELMQGRVSRRKACVGVVLMMPAVVVVLLLVVMLPGPWLAARDTEATKEKLVAELAAVGGRAEVGSSGITSLERELKDWRRWCFYGIRLMFGNAARGRPHGGFMFGLGKAPSVWDEAGMDNNLSREINRGTVYPWSRSWFEWVHFAAHQWLCPVAHYGRYRKIVLEHDFVVLTGRGSLEAPIYALPEGASDALEGMNEVSAVTVKGMVVNDALVKVLVSRKKLRRLVVEQCEVSDGQLLALAGNGGIEELVMVPSRAMGGESWAALGKWPGLERVAVILPRFEVVKVEGAGVAALIANPSLKELKVSGRVQLDDARPVVEALLKKKVQMGPECVFVLKAKDAEEEMRRVLGGTGAAVEMAEDGER